MEHQLSEEAKQPQDKNIAAKDPLTLAFVGDAVWTLHVRENIIKDNNRKTGELHIRTSKLVCAGAQSGFFETIEPHLTATEQEVAKRARNAHNNTVPKSATLAEYKRSTAFEAVIGYNYLTRNKARLSELINMLDIKP